MTLSNFAHRSLIAVWFSIAVLVPLSASAGHKVISHWVLYENQPEIPQGGRANSIAVNPNNSQEILVASDSGGLFKSTNGGASWRHIGNDRLPVIFTQSIAYFRSMPGVVVVSAKADFKTNNGGNFIWRSMDGGETWDKRPLVVPNSDARLSAYEIAASTDSGSGFVGTSEGVFRTGDYGQSWTYSNVFASGDKAVYSVLMIGNNVYAGGPSGVRLGSILTPNTWTSPVIDPGTAVGIQDLHAFSPSPFSSARVFLVNGAGQLFRSEDNGSIWTLMPSAPAQGTCGGNAFIKTEARSINEAEFIDIYLGNRCSLFRLTATRDTNGVFHYPDDWHELLVDHTGTRDLLLLRDHDLLASNGGLHNTSDHRLTWHLTGGGSGGYNALQVTEIKTQYIITPGATDLYFGTRDNNVWWLGPQGAQASFPSEGFFLDMKRRIQNSNDSPESQITFMACAACNNHRTQRGFANPQPWINPFAFRAAPVLVRPDTYVQIARPSPMFDQLMETEHPGMWHELVRFPEELRDIPKVARSGEGDVPPTTIIYQPFRSPALEPEYHLASRFARVEKRLDSTAPATVSYPLMGNFGGVGINPTVTVAWYSVFGVDPDNPDHIIAPDVVHHETNGVEDGLRVKVTTDGGDTWSPIADLTEKVTRGGELLFRTNLLGPYPVCPVVTAVSFSPANSALVLIGTSEGGIFFSDDHGATWKQIAGSERATYITSFAWNGLNTVYVSTFGRGIWKLHNDAIVVDVQSIDDVCSGCQVVSQDGGPTRPPFDHGAVVFDGTILGVRTEKSRLREVFVTTGSSTVFFGDANGVTVTEVQDGDKPELEPLPKSPDGLLATGVVFTSDGVLTGTAFAKSQLEFTPTPYKSNFKGSPDSPTKGVPYVRLTTSAYNGVPTAVGGETIEVTGANFLAGKSYEVLIDGAPLKGDSTPDSSGAFTTRLSAPTTEGYHRVEVRAAGDTKVLDGTMFLVRPAN